MKVAIVKYNAGNIHSVMHALKRVGVDGILTDNFEELKSADKVIFPGVGEAGTTMKYLQERNLDKLIKDLKQPVNNLCVAEVKRAIPIVWVYLTFRFLNFSLKDTKIRFHI